MSNCNQDSRVVSKGYVACNYTPLSDTFWSAGTPTNSIYHSPRGGGEGVVGINTKNPNKALTVVGSISGTTNLNVGDRTTTNRVLTDLSVGRVYVNSEFPTKFPVFYKGATFVASGTQPIMTELFIDGNAGHKFIAQSGYTYGVRLNRAMATNPTGGTAVWANGDDYGLMGQLVNRSGILQWDNAVGWPAFAVNESAPWAPNFVTTGNTLNIGRIMLNPINHSQVLRLTVSGLTDTTLINWNIWLDYEAVKF